MKFVIINTDYPAFIEDDYEKHPGLVKKSFAEQLQHRYDTLFGVANFYSKNLKALGHESIDLFPNHEQIQLRWAKEHGIEPHETIRPLLYRKSLGHSWIERVFEAQVKYYKPDILYSMAMEFFRPEFLNALKKRYRFKLIGQHAAASTDNMRDLSAYDLLISSLPNYVRRYKAQGKKSRLIRLGFESSILNTLPETDKRYGVVHIGGYGPIHEERNEVLEKLATKVPVDFWGYGEDSLKSDSSILKRFHGFVGGIKMYEVLKASTLTITKHISVVAGKHANNMTLYEATGTGTLLLTDNQSDLSKIFVPEKEVIVYNDTTDLIRKTRYYLNHPDKAKVIAKAGQERTLKDHTYSIRMKELVRILEEEL